MDGMRFLRYCKERDLKTHVLELGGAVRLLREGQYVTVCRLTFLVIGKMRDLICNDFYFCGEV